MFMRQSSLQTLLICTRTFSQKGIGKRSFSNEVKYKFSVDNSVLNKSQRDFYESNGFLLLKGLVPNDALDRFNQRFQQICVSRPKNPILTVMRDVAIAKSEFKEGEKAITKVQDFCQDEELFKYCAFPEIVKIVKSLIGEDIMAMHTMFINKPPDPGQGTSRHPLHQDLYYFPFRPAERIVCSWTAMETINRQNGCLAVEPGSHVLELLPHSYPKWEGGVNKMYYGLRDYELKKSNLLHLEMGKGDTVFFHPLLIHGSGMNRSNGFRKAISCHYAWSHCNYMDINNDNQSIYIKEVEDIIKRKVGRSVDIIDIWRMKSRLVAGERVNL